MSYLQSIDWYRMAQPQADGYDTGILSDLDYLRFGWKHQHKTAATGFSWLAEGRIHIAPSRGGVSMGDDNPPAIAVAQERADLQTEYLNKWESGYYAISHYLDELWPFISEHGGKGCSSGHQIMTDAVPVHAVYVTVNDLQGCAQGIYHEYAHLRLETMGIYIEKHDFALLLNEPTELYDSSVRFDVKRPMSAVLHGLYAWLMFTENDWQLYKSGLSPLSEFRQYSERNLAKIEAGYAEVEDHAVWTPEGREFFRGITDWTDSLLHRCRVALAQPD